MKAPVLKVAADCAGASSGVPIRQNFQSIRGGSAAFRSRLYLPIPPCWVQSWVQKPATNDWSPAFGGCSKLIPEGRRFKSFPRNHLNLLCKPGGRKAVGLFSVCSQGQDPSEIAAQFDPQADLIDKRPGQLEGFVPRRGVLQCLMQPLHPLPINFGQVGVDQRGRRMGCCKLLLEASDCPLCHIEEQTAGIPLCNALICTASAVWRPVDGVQGMARDPAVTPPKP